jgi:hypothetical protein
MTKKEGVMVCNTTQLRLPEVKNREGKDIKKT